jgi:hypothetical protein
MQTFASGLVMHPATAYQHLISRGTVSHWTVAHRLTMAADAPDAFWRDLYIHFPESVDLVLSRLAQRSQVVS